MVGIPGVLLFLYPSSKPPSDWRVQSDGVNEHIAFWNTGLLGAQPTESSLLITQGSAAYISYSSPAQVAFRTQQAAVKIVNAIFGVRKTADQSDTTGAFVNCTDLAFTLAPTTNYYFRFEGALTAAATTTGLQLSVNGPASPSFLAFAGQISESVTAVRNGVGGVYDVAIAGTASAAAVALPFWLAGSITTGAAGGVFTLRMRTEVAASAATVKRGSVGQLIVVA